MLLGIVPCSACICHKDSKAETCRKSPNKKTHDTPDSKKHIESGVHGGKGTDAHKAAIVGDTVGDPFKDTSGPSLNILVKLMSMVSVVAAGLVVRYSLEAFGIF